MRESEAECFWDSPPSAGWQRAERLLHLVTSDPWRIGGSLGLHAVIPAGVSAAPPAATGDFCPGRLLFSHLAKFTATGESGRKKTEEHHSQTHCLLTRLRLPFQ